MEISKKLKDILARRNFSPSEKAKLLEILNHIAKLFEHYKENGLFFDDYVQSVLENNLDDALSCFRDLTKHVNLKRKGDSNGRRLQGMQIKQSISKRKNKN